MYRFLTLMHPKPFHAACSMNRVRTPVSIKSDRQLASSTQNILQYYKASRSCTHTEISKSTAGITTIKLIGSLGVFIKNVDSSGGEIVLSPRVFDPKSWVRSEVVPLKSHEGVATKAVGEN